MEGSECLTLVCPKCSTSVSHDSYIVQRMDKVQQLTVQYNSMYYNRPQTKTTAFKK